MEQGVVAQGCGLARFPCPRVLGRAGPRHISPPGPPGRRPRSGFLRLGPSETGSALAPCSGSPGHGPELARMLTLLADVPCSWASSARGCGVACHCLTARGSPPRGVFCFFFSLFCFSPAVRASAVAAYRHTASHRRKPPSNFATRPEDLRIPGRSVPLAGGTRWPQRLLASSRSACERSSLARVWGKALGLCFGPALGPRSSPCQSSHPCENFS